MSDEITTYILQTTFINVTSQEGSVLYVTDIKSSPFVVQNINVINCWSFYGIISIYDSSNLAFLTSNFTNNTGRIYSCKNCIIALIQNLILNSNCKFQNEIEACFLYASDGSSLAINYTAAINVFNSKEGGSIYTIDSTILLYYFQLNYTGSDYYGGCMMIVSSNLFLLNSSFNEYSAGCLFVDGSNITLITNNFTNTKFKNQQLTYASTIACVNCEKSTIIGCLFLGNYNNTRLGGVNFKILNILIF